MKSFLANFQSVLENWWKFEKIAIVLKFHKKHNSLQDSKNVLFYLFATS